MKKTLSIIALSALALLPLQAVQQVETLAQGAPLVQDDGYVLFIYGKGWATDVGKETCIKLMADADVQKALGNAVTMLVPYYNGATDAQKEEIKGIMEFTEGKNTIKLDYPGGTESYPAIVFYSGKTRQTMGMLCSKEVLESSPAKLAKHLKKLHDGLVKQTKLLAAAETATGAERNKLMLEAARIPELNRPKEVNKNAMLAADKDDTAGYAYALEYYNGNVGKMGEKAPDGTVLTTESYLARLDKDLANPLLTTEQKQNACAMAIGVVHRAYGKGGTKLIRKYAKQMKALDPKSKLGISADTVIRDWTADGLVYTMGWDGDTVPMDTTPIELFGKLGITQGTCTVTFKHTGGGKRATVKAVTLFDGKKKIAEDVHDATVNNTEAYTLNVPVAPKQPHLFITFDVPQDGRDTRGDITVEMK